MYVKMGCSHFFQGMRRRIRRLGVMEIHISWNRHAAAFVSLTGNVAARVCRAIPSS